MKITIREPGSALTHYIAMMLAMLGAVPLLIRRQHHRIYVMWWRC